MDLSRFNRMDFLSALKALFKDLHVPVNYLADEPTSAKTILKDTWKDNASFQLMKDVYFLGIVDDAAFTGNKSIDASKIQSDYDGVLIFGVTLRESIQRMAFGSPTSIRRNAKKFYSIYLNIPEIRDALNKTDVYLSLPGIERKYFEMMSDKKIENAKFKIYADYGTKTVKFWVQRAQLNVGVKQKVKEEVRYRDNRKCRICTAIKDAYAHANLSAPNQLNQGIHQVSHIIARRAIFWHLLDDINKSYESIFCNEAVEEIETRIKQNRLYSGKEYLVYLCKRHDKIVQDVIKDAQLLEKGCRSLGKT